MTKFVLKFSKFMFRLHLTLASQVKISVGLLKNNAQENVGFRKTSTELIYIPSAITITYYLFYFYYVNFKSLTSSQFHNTPKFNVIHESENLIH